jgi:branched-chain amino acid transport system ATP-binding protein
VSTDIELTDVSVAFGGVQALRDVNISIRSGLITGLIGPNGAGKTTLLNVISGAIRPDRGSMLLGRDKVRRWSMTRGVDAGLVRTFQEPRVFHGLSVRENLRLASVSQRARHDPQDAALRACELMRLGPLLDALPTQLPFGQLRRVSLGIAMATSPRWLLMDEPSVGLSPSEVEELLRLIRSLKGEGVTILLVEHNMRLVMSVSDHIVVLNQGTKLMEGTPAFCQASEELADLYLGRRHRHV